MINTDRFLKAIERRLINEGYPVRVLSIIRDELDDEKSRSQFEARAREVSDEVRKLFS